MPKNRDVQRRKRPTQTPTDPPSDQRGERPGIATARFVAGLCALLAGLASTAVLALDHLPTFTAPGCGTESACATAQASVFGYVPFTGGADGGGWPVAFAGLAYVVAMLAAWIASKPVGVTAALRWMARLGAIASLGYVGLIVWKVAQDEKFLCPYCVAAHLANFALLAVVETAARGERRSAKTLVAAAAGFVLASIAAGGIQVASVERAAEQDEDDLIDSIRQLTERDADANPSDTPDAPATPEDVADAAREAGDAIPLLPYRTLTPEQRRSRAEQAGLPLPASRTSREGFTGNYLLGRPDAPIRLVVLSSYQCRDCQRKEKEIMEVLRERDDVSFSHLHFPFAKPCNPTIPRNVHANSCWASRAAETAGVLGGPEGFWQMHLWLFERGGGFVDAELTEALQGFGYDPAEFKRIMMSDDVVQVVQRDVALGTRLGLHTTPMIFINGVELRGWNAPNAVRRAVEAVAATNPTPATAAGDAPPDAIDKAIGDWREARSFPTSLMQRTDSLRVRRGPDDAAVHIIVFGDYEAEPVKRLNDRVNELIAERGDVALTFRHYPLHEDCNIFAEVQVNENACTMHRAVEAVGRLAGDDAYWRLHDWLFENQSSFTRERMLLFVQNELGISPADVTLEMQNPVIDQSILGDASFVSQQRLRRFIPLVFVNGRWLRRWVMTVEGEPVDVLGRVVEIAAGQPAG